MKLLNRPTFSLRTLFVVVTLIACWLGYQLNWIRQRHSLVDEPQKNRIEPNFERGLISPSAPPGWGETKTKDAPWPLRWLGERGVYHIFIPDDINESEEARIHSLFPEAEITRLSEVYFEDP